MNNTSILAAKDSNSRSAAEGGVVQRSEAKLGLACITPCYDLSVLP